MLSSHNNYHILYIAVQYEKQKKEATGYITFCQLYCSVCLGNSRGASVKTRMLK